MKTRKLNRDSNSRVALFKGLAAAVIDKEEVKTTAAKARAVRSVVEHMITKALTGSVHARRQIQSDIQNPGLVKKLFDEIVPRYQGIKGGFTKLTMIGTRKGDNAPIVKLALTKKAAVAAPKAKSEPKVKEPKVKAEAPLTAQAGKVVAPKAVKSTRTVKVASKAGMVRKTGER